MPRVRTIFVSCGQLSEPEKALGCEIAERTPWHATAWEALQKSEEGNR
jgi:hypothetical protein